MLHNGKAYLDCITRQQAQELWQKALDDSGYLSALPYEEIPVEYALGRVVARSVYAAQSVPHYNGAAMDGIAVRAGDTFGASETEPRRFSLVPLGVPLIPGTCSIVDTGDLMPQGADAVIMIEEVHIQDGSAEIMAAAAPWQHVRIIGEDIVAKELVLREGQVIGPAHVGALFAAGLETVPVVTVPKVAVIPTGSELVATPADLKPGYILDVNSRMLAAAVTSWGALPQRQPIVRDDFELLKETVRKALDDHDMIIINAGTSAGTEDFTASVLASLGTVLVHGVSTKPGKPVVLALCEGKPVIGLPGYPVSAMLTAELYVRPVLLARQNLPLDTETTVEASSTRQIYSHIGVEEYIRVTLGQVNEKVVATPLGRGAGLISTLTKAQGLLTIPAANDGLAAGTKTTVRLYDRSAAVRNLLAVGSHDMALDIMGVYWKRRDRRDLTCANVGSMGGIMAIKNGECHLAGIHLLDAATGTYNIPFVRKYLPNCRWRLVHFARREQGIITARDNPQQISSLRDLAEKEMVFVNRQRGSGTRMLLDYELQRQGLSPQAICGYEKEVATHMAVAASVAAGAAHAGMGIRAAAEALGLAFVTIGYEQYDLLVNLTVEEEWNMLIAILQSEDFRCEVEALGGYDLTNAGQLLAQSEIGEA